jgi:hypothetical protein
MHPINPNYFGSNGIIITYSLNGSNTVSGHIVEQLSQNQYIVAPGPIGLGYANTYATVTLATTTAQVAALPANCATIAVSVFGGGTEHAMQLLGRKLTTVEGNTYQWFKTTASQTGQCNVSGNWITGPDAAGFYYRINT